MSFNNIKTMKSERGFTIVELLIVIVVIGILAGITIVAYNGVTARANTSAARVAGNSVLKKAEAYNADLNGYPTLPTNLTDGASVGKSFNVPTGSFNTAGSAGVPPGTAPARPSIVNFFGCGAGVGS